MVATSARHRLRRTATVAAGALAAALVVWPLATGAGAAEVGPTDFRISDMGPTGQPGYTAQRSKVAYNPVARQYLVVWEGTDADPFKASIYGQLVDARTGAEVGANDVLLASMPGDASTDAIEPAVAYSSARNEFVVVYAGDSTTDSPPTVVDTFEIYAQRVSATNVPVGTPLRVSDMGSDDTNGSYDARTPDVAYDATTDSALVVWSGDDNTALLVNNELEIYGQRITWSGGGLAESGVNDVRLSDMGPDGSSAYDARDPAVAWNSATGEYLVAWSGNDAVANDFPIRVFGQRVAATGSETGVNDVLLGSTGDEALTPDVAYAPSTSEYLVVWSGDGVASDQFDVYGQRVNASGTEVGGDSRISNVPSSVSTANTPAVAYVPVDDEYAVVWTGDNPSLGTGDDDFEAFGARLSTTLGVVAAPARISAMGGSTTSTQTADVAASDAAARSQLVVWTAENQGVTAVGEGEVWGQLFAPTVDLFVTKTATPASVVPGGTVTFTITYGNSGPATATGVVITDTLPAGVTGVAVNSGSAVLRSGSGPTAYTWDVASLTLGATGVITITATVAGDGTKVNTVSISTSAATPDTAPGNNTASASVTVDGPPSVTVNQAAGQADPTNTSPITFTAVFSEDVTGFDATDVQLGGTAGATTAVVTGGPKTYTVAVTGMTGNGTVTASVPAGAATDTAGNTSTASTSTDNTVTYDATAPTVTVNQEAGQADPTNTSPILFTAVFSEDVTGFDATDVQVEGTGGGTVTGVTGGPRTYTVAVTPAGTGTVIPSVPGGAATDAAGNPSTASTSTDGSVTYDAVAPTVTINQAAGQADPTNTSPILFTAVFSEDVTGFDATDVQLGGTGGATTAVVTGGPKTYTIAVSGMTATGTVVVTIPAGAATDTAGNPSAASTSTDNTVTYIANTAPEVSVVGGACSSSTVSATVRLLVTDAQGDTVTLSVASSDPSLVPPSGAVLGGTGADRTLTVTPVAGRSGTAVLTLTADDGSASSTTTVTVLVGTGNADVLTGTAGADMVFGLGGADQVDAGNGNDVVCGANGDDVLRGGPGNDALDGANGHDRLEGGDGDDTMWGGRGADWFLGGPGTDVAVDFTPRQGDRSDGTNERRTSLRLQLVR